ncbi:MAG: AMP-binding protein [Clostridia bacterium]|nr:AMP-binding protein [Clostridia bacterium]
MYKYPLYKTREITDIRDMIRSSTEIFGDKPAFLVKKTDKYEPVSYKEYMADVNALGTKLMNMGLKGEKIAVIGEASYAWAVSYMAVVCGVGVVVPLDKELPREEIINLIEIADVKMIIHSEKVKNLEGIYDDKKVSMGMELDELIEEGKVLLANGDRTYLDAEIDREGMSILLFTSGTTGMAKGVMHSHNTICENLMQMPRLVEIGPWDTFLSVLPIHHTYECTCGFLCPLYMGGTIAHSEGLRYITKNLKEVKPTIILGVPLLYEKMYNNIFKAIEKKGLTKKVNGIIKASNALRKVGVNLTGVLFKSITDNLGGRLRILVSGAAAIDPKVAQGFKDLGINFVQGYGLTECAPIAALNRDKYSKNDAAGLPLYGVEIRIENPNELNIGEIMIKGKNLMLGYYENSQLTAEAIEDGWYHSGDLGYIDEDGFIHITGRKKDVIVTSNGKNIFPEELETYLSRSPYIAESFVRGKEKGNDLTVAAQIIPDYDEVKAQLGEGYTQEMLIDLIKEEITKVNEVVQDYKRIATFSIRQRPFDKTTTHKIKRFSEENLSEEGNIQKK